MLTTGCSKMNDKHDVYLRDGERIYIGKIDSIKVFPGDNRLQIKYWVSDPRVKKVGFYWYPMNDSIFTEIDVTSSTNPFEVFLGEAYGKPIEEGNYTLKIITYDNKGNNSVATEENFSVYGEQYYSGLINRPLHSTEYSYENNSLTLVFSEFAINEDELGVNIFYTDNAGERKTFSISSDNLNKLSTFTISDIDPLSEVSYNTQFIPNPMAIDTFTTENIRIPIEIVKIVNVALNKPVTTSDNLDEASTGKNAVDGDKVNNTSRWVTSYDPIEHWLVIDLLEEYDVFSIQTFIRNDYPVPEFMYQVEVNGEWVTVAGEVVNDNSQHKAEFPARRTSKVRYYVPAYRGNMVRMFEIEVWAKVKVDV